MKEVAVIIPSRCEAFLKNTVEDLLAHSETDFEVIVTLDGQWADPPLVQSPRVNLVYVNKSVGQRAAMNLACKLSKAKWIAKADAHCAFDQGWDRKMIEAFEKVGEQVTMSPIMRNLHVFNLKCYHCGWKMYQGPTPEKCPQCGKDDKIKRQIVWIAKHNPQSTSYCFSPEPKFAYFEDYKHRPVYIKDRAEKGLTETMSLQGSFFMCTREKYWELELCDEKLGNWGNQGVELACKTWLSGGRVLVNHSTYYGHMFRTQGGDFSFPWPVSGRDVQRTKNRVRALFWNGRHPKQIHPVSWLVERFSPVPGWSEEDLAKLKAEESNV